MCITYPEVNELSIPAMIGDPESLGSPDFLGIIPSHRRLEKSCGCAAAP